MINLNAGAKSVVEGDFAFMIDGSSIAASAVRVHGVRVEKGKFVQRAWQGAAVSNR